MEQPETRTDRLDALALLARADRRRSGQVAAERRRGRSRGQKDGERRRPGGKAAGAPAYVAEPASRTRARKKPSIYGVALALSGLFALGASRFTANAVWRVPPVLCPVPLLSITRLCISARYHADSLHQTPRSRGEEILALPLVTVHLLSR